MLTPNCGKYCKHDKKQTLDKGKGKQVWKNKKYIYI